MKKAASLFLAILLLFVMIPFHSFAADNTPVKISIVSDAINLYENVDGIVKSSWNGTENVDWFYYNIPLFSLLIDVTYANGDITRYSYADLFSDQTDTFKTKDDQSVNNQWGLGEHQLNVEYLGLSALLTVKITESPVKNIDVDCSTLKLINNVDGNIEYDNSNGTVNEWFYYNTGKVTELPVTVEFKDGTKKVYSSTNDLIQKLARKPEITSDQSYNNQWGIGTHEFTYSFLGIKDTVAVEVVENPISGIEVVDGLYTLNQNVDGAFVSGYENGQKVTYFKYDTTKCNFKLKLNYKDGHNETYTESQALIAGYQFIYFDDQSAGNQWGIGEHTVSVSFMGFTLNIPIEVKQNTNASIKIFSMPKDEYYSDEYPELTGIVLRIFQDDGTFKDIKLNNEILNWAHDTMTVNGYELKTSLVGGKFTIEYLGKTDTIQLNIKDKPKFTDYTVDDAPIMTSGEGLKVTLTDNTDVKTQYTIKSVYAVNRIYYVKTDKGVFIDFYASKSFSNLLQKYVYNFSFRGMDIKVESNPKSESGDIAQSYMTYILMMSNRPTPESLHYNGVIDKNNIDNIINIALFTTGVTMYKQTFTKAEVQTALDKTLHNPSFNLEESAHYNIATDEYDCDLSNFSGYYCANPVAVQEDKGGGHIYQINFSEMDINGKTLDEKTVYLSLDRDMKIKTIRETCYLLGDIDLDCDVNVFDLYVMKKLFFQMGTVFGENFYAADLNCDDNIDLLDLFELKKAIIKYN